MIIFNHHFAPAHIMWKAIVKMRFLEIDACDEQLFYQVFM